MHFTRLNVLGFKSFVSETELVIAPGLTGIVGPNGCGKSNLVEALRWVMGESSAKSLRGGEMDEVIFGGTLGRPARNLAEVRLTLDNGKRDAPSPPNIANLNEADEIEISRQITRHQGSLYRINGKETRARDVQLFFADAGSGAHSPALVSQGRVAALIASRREERRALLEDAAGIGGLYARRSEAESRLAAAAANLLRVADVVTSLASRRDALARQVEDARHYRRLSAEIRATEAAIFRWQWLAAERELKASAASLASCRTHLAEQVENLAALSQKLPALSQNLEQARQLYDQTSELIQKLRLDVSAAENEQQRQLDAQASLDAQCQQLAREREREQNLADEAARETQALAMALVELQPQIANDPSDALKLQQESDKARQFFALSQARKDALGREIALLTTQKQQQERARLAQQERQNQLELERSRLAAQQAALDRENDAATAHETQLAQKFAAECGEQSGGKYAHQSGAELDSELAALRQQRQALETAITQERQQLQSQAAAQADAQAALARLQGERDGLQQSLAVWAQENEAETAASAAPPLFNPATTDRDTPAPVGEDSATQDQAWLSLAELVSAEIGSKLDPDAAAAGLVKSFPEYAKVIFAVLGDAAAAKFWDAARDVTSPETDPADAPHNHPFWHGLAADPLAADPLAADPPPPSGRVTALTQYVPPPPPLARLFAQVFLVASAAEAWEIWPSLAVGQILVSAEGAVWRWDGYYQPANAKILQAERQAAEAARQAKMAAEWQEAQAKIRADRQAAQAKIQSERAARLVALDSEIAHTRSLYHQRQAERQKSADHLALSVASQQELARQEQSLRQILDAMRQAEQASQQRRAAWQTKQSVLAEQQARWQRDAERLARDSAGQDLSLDEEVAWGENAAGQGVSPARSPARSLENSLATAQQNLTLALGEYTQAQIDYDAARQKWEKHKQGQTARSERLRQVEQDHAAWTRRTATAQQRVQELDQLLQPLQARRQSLNDAPQIWQQRSQELAAALAQAQQQREHAATQMHACDKELSHFQQQHQMLQQNQAQAREALIRAEMLYDNASVQHKNLVESMGEKWQLTPAQFLAQSLDSPPNLAGTGTETGAGAETGAETETGSDPTHAAPDDSLRKLKAALERKTRHRDELGKINLRAEADADALDQEADELSRQKSELEQAIAKLTAAIDDINRDGRQRLLAAFIEVDRHFRGLFEGLFGGGRAELKLSNQEDPLQAGLEIFACPPGKNLQNLSLLSGGEQALTCLALIFAVFLTHPAPICVLDEVDAPLDDANVDRFCQVLRKITQDTATRFLVVTHHRLTMAKMDRLFGVTMPERGVSQIVSVDLSQARAVGAR